MSYMGNSPPNIGAYGVESFDGGGTSFTLSKTATTATVLLFIDGVRQTPGDAYSVSGTTLTTTATTPSGTDNVTVQFLGDVVDFGEPSDDSVTSAKIADNAVGNSEMADDAVGVAELSATGTASSSTYLRGDNSWATVSEYDDSGLQDDIAILGFKVASNGSLSKYDLVDQAIDDFQDATGIDASASTDEVRNASNYYSGGVSGSATGGTTETYSSGGTNYTSHTFLSSGTFTVSSGSGNVDALVVGGGGNTGGTDGNNGSGGGGAGGFRAITGHAVTAQAYSVTVGAAQSDSSFSTITASGGGAGGTGAGSAGGSGGGTGGWTSGTLTAGGAGNLGGYSPVEGYDGGYGSNGGGSPPCPNRNGGGGGGAGGVGSNAQVTGTSSTGNGGSGGAGATNDFRTGANVTYAGGGGGSGTNSGGSGGSGGGGAGGSGYGSAGGDGTANTGGGAGGGSHGTSGATGGTGIVVIRYADGAFVAYNDMTLVSNSTTAEATPTSGDLVMTYTNGAGTATVNTDLKAYISRDNGTTWTQATLSSEGTTGSHTILTAHNVDISSQPSGTSMRYKIETLNQSASKETRIQAVSLGWS